MKICWDVLEKVVITKNGNFRHTLRGTLYEKEKCCACNEPFLGKKKEKTCCRECSYVITSKSHIGSKRSKKTRDKISKKAKKRKPKTKHTIESVKNHLKDYGYNLLSTEYRNNKIPLKIECPKGHLWITSYFSFQQGSRCLRCSGKKRNDYKYIKENVNIDGYLLLSKKYVNAHEKLKIKCPKGHMFYMRFNNFQQGQRCPECNKYFVVSKEEKEVYNYVKSIIHENVIANDRTQIKNPKTGRYLELDIWIPSLSKAIEYNGEYWHNKEHNNDKIKKKQCKKRGINLLVITDKTKNYKEIIEGWLYES